MKSAIPINIFQNILSLHLTDVQHFVSVTPTYPLGYENLINFYRSTQSKHSVKVEAFIMCLMYLMPMFSCQIYHLLPQFFPLLLSFNVFLFHVFFRMNQNYLKESSALSKWSENEKSLDSDVQSEAAKPIRKSIKEEFIGY